MIYTHTHTHTHAVEILPYLLCGDLKSDSAILIQHTEMGQTSRITWFRFSVVFTAPAFCQPEARVITHRETNQMPELLHCSSHIKIYRSDFLLGNSFRVSNAQVIKKKIYIRTTEPDPNKQYRTAKLMAIGRIDYRRKFIYIFYSNLYINFIIYI